MPTNEKTSPGPWTTSAPLSRFVIDKDRDCVCECRTLADARLIAAAPEMLELLREFVDKDCPPHGHDNACRRGNYCPHKEARALLKRIDGDQP